MFYWPWELRNVINEARIMMFGYDANIKVLAAKNLMEFVTMPGTYLRDLG